MNTPRVPPRFVPTLTEVVEFEEAQVLGEASAAPVEPIPQVAPEPEVAPAYEPAYAPADPFAQAANAPLDSLADWQQPVPDLAVDALVEQFHRQAHTTEPAFQNAVGTGYGAPEQALGAAPVEPVEFLVSPQPAPAVVVAEDVPAFLLATPPAHAWVQPDSPAPAADAPPPAELAQVNPVAQLDAEREEQIVQNVLLELQRRADLMLEYRLRESLAPILARLCDSLIKEARQDLAATLRDVVARAVAQELTRHRSK